MNRRHMTGDHHGRAAGRANLLVTPTDEILGTHRTDATATRICQSFVSRANGGKIRTLREPNSTITASSSSTRTTQPRPYLSWVT